MTDLLGLQHLCRSNYRYRFSFALLSAHFLFALQSIMQRRNPSEGKTILPLSQKRSKLASDSSDESLLGLSPRNSHASEMATINC